jgi:spermidine/putrescine transport system ATP-binding protein
MQERLIRLVNIAKPTGKGILKGLNLYIRDREFLTILGPSGCGKTTTPGFRGFESQRRACSL